MKKLMPLLGLVFVSAAQTPEFDAASVKLNRSLGGRSSIQPSKGRITMENVSLRKLTLWAYGIPDDRQYALVGPEWLSTEAFDVQATFAADTTAPQLRQMVQHMLAARFHLALHPESREMTVAALTLAKSGLKI